MAVTVDFDGVEGAPFAVLALRDPVDQVMGVKVGFHIPVADVIGRGPHQALRSDDFFSSLLPSGFHLALDVAHGHGAGLAVGLQNG